MHLKNVEAKELIKRDAADLLRTTPAFRIQTEAELHLRDRYRVRVCRVLESEVEIEAARGKILQVMAKRDAVAALVQRPPRLRVMTKLVFFIRKHPRERARLGGKHRLNRLSHGGDENPRVRHSSSGDAGCADVAVKIERKISKKQAIKERPRGRA